MYSIQKSTALASDVDVAKVKSYIMSQLDNYTGITNTSATKKIKSN